MAQAIEQLELEVNNALGNLGLIGWSVRFDIERETRGGKVTKPGFHVFIKSPENDRAVAWEAWSGGETQRLRLAGSIGLSNLILARAGVSLPFEVWDEPSTYLSGEGITDMLETLYDRARMERKQVWLIDHRSLDFGGFEDTYTVVATSKGTRLQ
jgi:DNA repair exonuclease SbcCD ATPase subunit